MKRKRTFFLNVAIVVLPSLVWSLFRTEPEPEENRLVPATVPGDWSVWEILPSSPCEERTVYAVSHRFRVPGASLQLLENGTFMVRSCNCPETSQCPGGPLFSSSGISGTWEIRHSDNRATLVLRLISPEGRLVWLETGESGPDILGNPGFLVPCDSSSLRRLFKTDDAGTPE